VGGWTNRHLGRLEVQRIAHVANDDKRAHAIVAPAEYTGSSPGQLESDVGPLCGDRTHQGQFALLRRLADAIEILETAQKHLAAAQGRRSVGLFAKLISGHQIELPDLTKLSLSMQTQAQVQF
jgi:hypothetical protein